MIKNISLTSLILLYFWLSMIIPTAQAADSRQQLANLLATHRGNVIYLDFWASWCIPCRKSFPWMAEMQTKYQQQGLIIVSVNLDTEPALAHQFLKQNPIDFKVVFDHQALIAKDYQLKGMPSSFLIGRDGELKATHVGFFNNQKTHYQNQIKALLATL